ncbi:hypothetical protein HCN44_001073 [Aphidius gifuensis]|uniref:KICSTOR complex protein kaptin-like n=1 Tax=Aphidius gifuensis TaxID=684658 RepID=A0A834XKB8_APHGI|nr:hypothetical protein HCN44_001073 [Aphidius gifuensis]
MIDNKKHDGDLNSLINIHFFPLTSQGNIYSMSKLSSSNGTNKILVASLKRKIYSCEADRENNVLRPIVKELLFTYIPNGAEIISIDGYNKKNFEEEYAIGITIIKRSGDGTMERYLNIYSETSGDGDSGISSIETIAQNCLTVELSYTPYLLYHTFIYDKDIDEEIVWLISDKLSHGYVESKIDKYFPEFINLNALALWIDIYYYNDNKRRITAIGCQCGLVKITIVEIETLKIIDEWKLRYASPISNVRIFPRFNNKTIDDKQVLDILIVNLLNRTIVFSDVLRNGLKNDFTLVTENADCILTSIVADINMDGVNEILLGTYTHEIYVFKINCDEKWILSDKRKFDSPVYSMSYLDITNDGMKELIVLTQRGVYILQHDLSKIQKILDKRLAKLSKHYDNCKTKIID